MIYKIEFESKARIIEEVEAETVSEAITKVAKSVAGNLDGVCGIYEFSIKEHKEQGE